MDKGASFRCCRFRGQIANPAERERATKGRTRTANSFLYSSSLPEATRAAAFVRDLSGARERHWESDHVDRFPRSVNGSIPKFSPTPETPNNNRVSRRSHFVRDESEQACAHSRTGMVDGTIGGRAHPVRLSAPPGVEEFEFLAVGGKSRVESETARKTCSFKTTADK